MIHSKYIKYAFAGILMISVGSCKKEKLQDVNISENNPLEITPSAALPATEVAIAYTLGGDMSRFTSIFMQHVTGDGRQAASFNNYSVIESDVDKMWKEGMYAGPMFSLYTQMEKTKTTGNKHYSGISKILMAYSVGLITDLWGNAPYSDAFKGANQKQPKYDTQQNLYNTMQQLLADGKKELSGTSGPLQPGSEDLVYGGNVSSWKKFANALSARYCIHLSKVDSSASQKALNAINAGAFTSNADDAQVKFGSSASNASPWYQYNDNRGDIWWDGFAFDTLIALKDPRLPIYLDTTGYAKKGDIALGNYLGGATSPVYFMTYFEQKFIEAEAYNRLNKIPESQAAYTEAIIASMEKTGVDPKDIATYLVANGTLTGDSKKMLYKIMFQKYLAMYLQPESWTDWRRTGSPALKKVNGAIINAIPRRLVYPSSERVYNANNTPAASLLTTRLWWDK
jgi:hypothetical protein